MTLDDLDQLLAQWKVRTDAAAERLVELRSLPAYEIIAGGGGAGKLTLAGITAERIGPAIAALEQVWQDYGVLSSTVQRASELRRQMPRFSISQDKLREIETLLTGPAISIPGQSTIADRDLLYAKTTNRWQTLQQLLERMNAEFVAGRNGLLEIEAGWNRLNSGLPTMIKFLETYCAESVAGLPELRQMVETLRPRVMADPLGAKAEFDRDVEPLFNRVSAAVERLLNRRKNLRQDLLEARKLLKALGELREQSEQAFNECREKISGRPATEPALPSQRIEVLGAWLKRLEQSGSEMTDATDQDAIGDELEIWNRDAGSFIAAEERALSQNRGKLEFRRELRGRLSALKAKAAARRVADDERLVELAERAGQLLYSRPTPIDEASACVAQYEALLNGRDPLSPRLRRS